MKTKLFGLFVAAFCLFAIPSCSDDDGDDLNLNQVPTTIKSAFQAKYASATDVDWEKKGNYYVVDFKYNQLDMDVWYNAATSKEAMTVTDYGRNLFYLPPTVERAFATGEYGSWTVDDITYYERTDTSFFLFEVEKAGEKDMDLYYSPDGTLIKAVPESNVDITPDTVI